MAFKIDELEFRNDSKSEQVRTRIIFEALKVKALKQEELTEHEKDFFCSAIRNSVRNDGRIEDFPCCDHYRFKSLYRSYFRYFAGANSFIKVKGTDLYTVEPKEIQLDLQYLFDKSDEWDLVVQKTNHKSQLLQQISTETRNELKNLSNQAEFLNDPNSRSSEKFIINKRAILCHSKFIYCVALEVFEKSGQSDFILEINSIQIEFNEFSFVHILNRHFAEIIKQFRTGKSFHNKDFNPRIISVQLKNVLSQIDASKLLKDMPVDKIGFQLNGNDYLIWTSEMTKSIKGKGNINFRRLDSFYPVSDESEKRKLISTCDLKAINNVLSVYVPM